MLSPLLSFPGPMNEPTPIGHYVYAHRKLSDLSIFYIGKGRKRRAWDKQGRNPWWKRVVDKHGYSVHILRDGLSEPCSLSLERAMIFALRQRGLVNLVDGGGGTSGWKHSEETKVRIGSFHKGREFTAKMRAALELANANRILTPETRTRMSAARSGRKFGPRSAECRAKISQSHMGMKASAETIEKLRLSHIGKSRGKNSPAYDHKIRRFIRSDGEEFTGTRADFIATYSLAHGCVSAMINGNRKTVKGWRLA